MGNRDEIYKDYLFYFKENLNIHTFERKERFLEVAGKEVVVSEPVGPEVALVKEEPNILSQSEELKIKLNSIKKISKKEQLTELNKLREELYTQKLTYPEEVFRFYENEIQKNIYWTQKFMTVNDLNFGEEIMAIPFEAPLKNRIKKKRKVKGMM